MFYCVLTASFFLYRMPKRCSKCRRGLPDWDSHARCSQHRECTKTHPCATCKIWPAQTWASAEAWLQNHPPILRAPALVPSAAPAPPDVNPVVTVSSPTQPENPSPRSCDGETSPSPLDLHASDDSELERDVEDPSRSWRPAHAGNNGVASGCEVLPTANPLTALGQSAAGPSGPLPLLTATLEPGLTSAVGWHTPLMIGGVSDRHGSQQAPGLRNLTSAVGRHTPVMIGGVSGRARDPPVPGQNPPGVYRPAGILAPGSYPAGVPTGRQRRSLQPSGSGGDLAAGPAGPEETPSTARQATTTRKAAKRTAILAPPAPPGGKKKKKKGEKKQKKGRPAPVSDTDLYSMMELIASRHGWALGEVTSPASAAETYPGASALTALVPLPVPPAYQIPRRVSPNRAPAALGAPPGEEFFPPQVPELPTGAHTQPVGSALSVASESDWPSVSGAAHTDTDTWSVTSGAPSFVEQEASPGLRHLSEEAEALLLRYMEEFYTVQPDTAEQQPQPSMLFRSGAEPDLGIPLTADFKQEYERLAREPPPRGPPPSLRRSFLFQPGDTAKFLTPEKLSPELLALGDHVSQGNPLQRRAFKEESRRWTDVASLARSSMRLAAYAGALSNLAVQADSLQMSQEDRALLSSIMMTISELMWKQSTRTAMYSTRRRRDLALSALGFSEQQRSQLTRDMPFEGPFLFSGQFTPRVKEQLAVRHTARELAGQLRLPQASRPRTFTQPRAQPHTQAAPPRVTTTFPAPQPIRGSRGGRGRGRSQRGRYRGQRGHRQAAQGRGGF